jgi:hypothetical protein
MVKNENDKTAIIAFILNPPVEQRLIFGETGTGCQSQVIQGPTDQRTDRARSSAWEWWRWAKYPHIADGHRAVASHRPIDQKTETMTFNYLRFAG